MHLKSLTVRGFKSFASATTFDFEPGVTAVVGPNGSGKSNVVDALAWVMGEQGAKTLRGGKMEDVIFAGTSGRPPLGRAHVALTIDNSDGALPIDYAEVTISRTLFRAGGSEYAINGTACRLLDIQELLSDSGLGREMHVIVGQGQLDKVLHATPEDRRGFIEEAAGILKHRRRKEKTLRKLDAMGANLARLTDLTGEIRRQLTPLGKQAAVARRAQSVQFDVRDARARLLADSIVTLTQAVERDEAAELALKNRREHVERELQSARAHQAALEQQAAAATPVLNAARDNWYQLSATRDQLKALGVLATERRRHLGATEAAPDPSRDPDRLAEQAVRLREEEAELDLALEERRYGLETAMEIKTDAEAAVRAEEQRVREQLRASADRREGLAKLAGKVAAARSRVESAEAEIGRLHHSKAAGAERHNTAAQEFAALESQVAGVEQGEERLDADYETAAAALTTIDEKIAALTQEQLAAERERDSLTARRDALAVGLLRKDASAQLLEARPEGVLASMAQLIAVVPSYETALAAALNAAAEGVGVTGLHAALAALELVKKHDGGRVTLVLTDAAGGAGTWRGTDADSADEHAAAKQATQNQHTVNQHTLNQAAAAAAQTVAGAVLARAQVSGPPELDRTLDALLAGVVLVPDMSAAQDVLAHDASLTAVSAAGDVFTQWWVQGGSAMAPSLLELQATVDETEAALAKAVARGEQTRFALAGLQGQRGALAQAEAEALAALNESDARLAAVAERLGLLGATLRSAAGESDRHAQAVQGATANLEREQVALEGVAARLAAAQEAPVDVEPSMDERDALAAAATAARAVELETRLQLRSTEDSLHATRNRAAALERAAATERTAREQAAQRAARRQFQARKAAAVASATHHVLALVQESIELAEHVRDEAEEQRATREVELMAVRSATVEAEKERARLTDSVHKDELARAAQKLRIETLENKSIEELGLSVDHLLKEYGPDTLVPLGPGEVTDKWAALHVRVDDDGNEIREGTPFVREEQEKRLKRAERDLAALGKVNPLALEEFAALEERHQFLSSQLEDLKSSRKDLLDIIKEVDQRVEEVFTAAYTDTAAQFEQVFSRLFPGGEGRLVLTDPENMLTTGIEIEARPAGKKIKRLSLLSGGERSLTAVALLVAIFKARPSPFYVMDEVEAALDDTNLGRLITLFEELRESSQLIIITHQKRTMEVADALYGVSMRGDGVSAVISQRMDRAAS
ncbi:chromosome segregation protein SMC [Arthrobacter alpinus]|uniref:Chromosome partition protein Smc n=1 Tax=Arthrobacter alpinus TaxID=656366 RepID=A0A0S2LZ41_9MICC|nr:chromosome segregation protein SMC [Arthrobacter alpinus]ALO66536.1 chromosome segregation protein SMC [Arthrobacter alpinus]